MQRYRRPGWAIHEREITSEGAYLSRREFLRRAGLAGLGVAAAAGLPSALSLAEEPRPGSATTAPSAPGLAPAVPTSDLYPVARNATFRIDRPLTDEAVAATHNNFYEFTTDKGNVWKLAESLRAWPWTVEIAGEVRRPGRLDVETLIRSMPLEERIYRLRCVEAWAMTVPWTGFPLRKLLERVEPNGHARFVRFTSFLRPDEAVGQKTQTWYPWPYYEALRLDEAMNDLAMVVTGIYGHPLPNQHGAPVRVIVPWKYGYKSPKSIVRIELVREQSRTFWNDLAPLEYGFLSNVNPYVPHPRWSQESEQPIGTPDRVPTLLFNGYGEAVASLYPDEPRQPRG